MIPILPKQVFHPTIIMVRWWPRVWAIECGNCNMKFSRFGWWGYVRCYWCQALNAPKWTFPPTGY